MTKKNSFILLGIIFALLLTACGGEVTTTPEADTANAFENYVPVASATGKVVPADWATVSIPTAGIIDDLLIAENAVVSEGDVLLILSGGEQLEAAIAGATLELVAAEQVLDNLIENAGLVSAEILQSLNNTRDAVRDAQRLVTNLNNPGKQTDIDQAFANMLLAEDRMDKAYDDYEPYIDKPESNLTRAAFLSKYAQARAIYDAAKRLYNNLTAVANEIDLAQAEADLAYAEALLSKLEKDFEDTKDGPDPDSLELAQARVTNAQKQIEAAQSGLNDLTLTAPFDGTISALYVRESEWVSPGQPMLLLGNLSNLQIETTDLNEIDVARIQVGSRATITFDALPDVLVEGTVVRIGTKASSGSSVNYTVIIEMDEVPAGLLWDMTAFVDIEVE